MCRKQLKKAVICYLKERGYKFLRNLGTGGFVDVIAVLTPDKQEEGIKIVPKKNIWPIEDQYWPTFHHPNLVQVKNVMEIEELDIKLYCMPILNKALYDMVCSQEFRNDQNSFSRIKKWILQILSALQYLHKRGFCHLDIKSDNVLIDNEDNALLADFSGLNFTKDPINRLCSPYFYRSPESFSFGSIQGHLYDMWTFSVLALNVFTGHYYLMKVNRLTGNYVTWWLNLLPLLQKGLKEGKFQKLMRNAYPKANLTDNDINLAHHFVEFIMKIKPETRPSAKRVKNHLLFKTISNPFTKDYYNDLQKTSQGLNPFQKTPDELHLKSQGEGNPERMKIGKIFKNWFVRKINKVFK